MEPSPGMGETGFSVQCGQASSILLCFFTTFTVCALSWCRVPYYDLALVELVCVCVCVCALLEEKAKDHQFFLWGGVILNSRCVIDISSSISNRGLLGLVFQKITFEGGGGGGVAAE